MFKGIPKQAFIITIVLVTLIYMGSYMFVTYNQDVDFLRNATEFLNSLKHTFLAACAITSITAIILVFNSNVQARQEKKKAVFDKKIELYLDIIDKMDEYFKPKDDEKDIPKIDENEKRELFFLQLKVLLLSNPETSSLYSDMVKDLTPENNEIKESSYINLMNFIFGARDDLEVQEKMSEEQREKFEDMKQNIKEEAKKVASISGGRTFFLGFDDWVDQMISGQEEDKDNDLKFRKPQNISNEQQKGLQRAHDEIIKLLSNSNKLDLTYSPTGGCSIIVLKKKIANIVPKYSFLEILALRDYKNNYYRPSIEGLEIVNCRKYNPKVTSTFTNWGHHMYIIKIQYDQINKFLPIICQLIESGCNTLKEDKVLNVGKKDWESEYIQRLETIFDSTYSI